MSWQYIAGVGNVHFQDVKPAKVVPGHERHKWSCKPNWGETTICVRWGCIKHMLKTQPFYTTRYTPPGAIAMQDERPPCTANPPIEFKP